MTSPARPRSLGRRAAFALVATAAFFGVATLVVAGLEREGVVDTFRQDDSVLYLQGRYLTVDPTGKSYQIMDAQAPKVVQATFPTRKKRGTFRVFVTGESFVRGGHHIPPGTPPVGYGTIADWTRQLLETRYPDTPIEVINAGANGQGSFRIAQVVEELVNVEPDLIVVAVGNNEGPAPVTAVSQELNDWILYRFVKKAVVSEPAKKERPAYQMQTLSVTDLERGFVGNVRRMVDAAKKKGVKLALAPLPLNLLDIGRTVTQQEVAQAVAEPGCSQVEALTAQRRCDEALAASATCSKQFFTTVRTADCFRGTQRWDEAREMYKVAIQIEPRGRTRPSYNEALRTIARENDLLMIDLEKGMEARAANGLTGDKYFIDAVHLTCMGYLPVARDIVDGIVEAGLIPGDAGPEPTAAELLAKYPWDPMKGAYVPPPHIAERTKRVCAADPTGG